MGSEASSIRTLCPTRWTVRAESLASILVNYNELLELWEQARQATSDTEMKARIIGIAAQMGTFRFLFGLILSEMILRHTDKLSQSLQNPKLSSTEGYEIAMLTVKTLQSLRTDINFGLLWDKTESIRVKWNVDEPQFPRKRKMPKRFEQGTGEASFHTSVNDLYRQVYFEAIDLAVSSIKQRFEQPGYNVYSKLEQLLKACAGENYHDEITFVCQYYRDDLDKCDLESQLKVLRILYTEKIVDNEDKTLKSVLQTLTPEQPRLVDMVCQAFQLLLVIPATNATSERSFSALRRIKTYLRSTMTQARMNHLMILNYYQDLTDSLDLKEVGNDFIGANESRFETIAKFT